MDVMTGRDQPRLLAGGNPQIAKGDGDGPVQAYIAAMPGWKGDVGRRLDELIVAAVPGVRKWVKWNVPFYSADGVSWFTSFGCLTTYVKIAFPSGTSLDPVPPISSKQQHVRYVHLYEDDRPDEALLTSWFVQAAGLPGER